MIFELTNGFKQDIIEKIIENVNYSNIEIDLDNLELEIDYKVIIKVLSIELSEKL